MDGRAVLTSTVCRHTIDAEVDDFKEIDIWTLNFWKELGLFY